MPRRTGQRDETANVQADLERDKLVCQQRTDITLDTFVIARTETAECHSLVTLLMKGVAQPACLLVTPKNHGKRPRHLAISKQRQTGLVRLKHFL